MDPDVALPPKAYVAGSPNMYLNKDKETIADLKDRIEELWPAHSAKSNYELAQENRRIKEESFELARTLENRLEMVSKENRRLESEKVDQLRKWREESAQMQARFDHELSRRH